MKSKPKQKKGTGAKMVVKAFAIAFIDTGEITDFYHIPKSTFIKRVFNTQESARNYLQRLEERQDDFTIVPVTITYTLPSTKLTKSKKK